MRLPANGLGGDGASTLELHRRGRAAGGRCRGRRGRATHHLGLVQSAAGGSLSHGSLAAAGFFAGWRAVIRLPGVINTTIVLCWLFFTAGIHGLPVVPEGTYQVRLRALEGCNVSSTVPSRVQERLRINR